MGIFKKHITVKELKEIYLEDRKMSLAKGTYQDVKSRFKRFDTWLQSQGLQDVSMRKLSNEVMTKFFFYLGDASEEDLDKSTCEKYLHCLKLFFKYALKKEYIENIPLELVTLPRKKRDCSPWVINKEDLTKLLTVIRWEDRQLYLACMFVYYCFIRPKELRNLKIENLNLEEGYVRVPMLVAKSRRTDIITMPHQLLKICRYYRLWKYPREYFIIGKGKRPGPQSVSVNSLATRFNRFRDRLGLPKMYKFYSLKHTGASMFHSTGVPIRVLMDHLRHTRLEATQHYLKKLGKIADELIRDHFPNPIVINNQN